MDDEAKRHHNNCVNLYLKPIKIGVNLVSITNQLNSMANLMFLLIDHSNIKENMFFNALLQF